MTFRMKENLSKNVSLEYLLFNDFEINFEDRKEKEKVTTWLI